MSAAQPESFPPPAAALALDQAFEPARRELLALLQRMTAGVDGSLETPIEGLYLHRLVQPTGPKPTMQNAALAVIAQGSKRLFIGDDVYEYDPFHYLVSSVDLPVVAKVVEEVTVLRRGEIVEQGPVRTVFGSPQHEYTKMLVNAAAAFDRALGEPVQ